MRSKFIGVAFAALILPASAWAQSTGTLDFEESNDVIVVTGRVDRGVGGVEVSDTAKAKGTLNQAFIARQTPGNSILDTINQLPGVSFQNNDPFGSAGGTLTVRGFDSTRISLTFGYSFSDCRLFDNGKPRFLVVGTEGQRDGNCTRLSGPACPASTSGALSLALTAPTTPGTYYIVARGEQELICSAGLNDSERIAAFCVP